MLNYTHKLVIGIAVLFTPIPEAFAAPGWSEPLSIQSFIPGEGLLQVLVPAGHANTQSCANSQFFIISDSQSNYALISSTLLTAFAQNRQVRFWQTGCTAGGGVAFNSVWISN